MNEKELDEILNEAEERQVEPIHLYFGNRIDELCNDLCMLKSFALFLSLWNVAITILVLGLYLS